MPAIELTREEIGVYDPARAKAIRQRLWSAPVPAAAATAPQMIVVDVLIPRRPREAVTCYVVPIGPSRKPSEFAQPKLKIRTIIKIVSHVYGVPINCLLSHRRTIAFARPRQEAMWLAKKYTRASLPEIAGHFDGRDHTTVIHSIRKIDSIRESGYVCKAEPYVSDWFDYLVERESMNPKPVGYVTVTPKPLYRSTRYWTRDDVERVRVLINKGWSKPQIAAEIGRSYASVKGAMERFNIKRPSVALCAE